MVYASVPVSIVRLPLAAYRFCKINPYRSYRAHADPRMLKQTLTRRELAIKTPCPAAGQSVYT
jgi:hypothetical protein